MKNCAVFTPYDPGRDICPDRVSWRRCSQVEAQNHIVHRQAIEKKIETLEYARITERRMEAPAKTGMLTSLLREYQGGSEHALGELFEILLPELRQKARQLLANERAEHTLQPTALVNDAFLRLFDGKPIPWQNSREFLKSAVVEMRRALVDHARRADSQKRQRRKSVELATDYPSLTPADPITAIALDQALCGMAEQSPRAVNIVELTVFAGLNSREIGEVLDISYRTVEREWQWARKWLKRFLSSNGDVEQ
ncbi:MAG TPA: ECF-type sigma factor [Bryobacteraceae bacterium]|nr:ECF-type sigma factor [Bryobacteraceae bacterium]